VETVKLSLIVIFLIQYAGCKPNSTKVKRIGWHISIKGRKNICGIKGTDFVIDCLYDTLFWLMQKKRGGRGLGFVEGVG